MFSHQVPAWSFGFIFDMLVDIYFVADVVLNFRTSFFNKDGTREDRLPLIRDNYMRGWFCIDFVSCLPLGYIPYLFGESDTESAQALVLGSSLSGAATSKSSAGSFRAVKVLRLVSTILQDPAEYSPIGSCVQQFLH
jgi:hypothetical protein